VVVRSCFYQFAVIFVDRSNDSGNTIACIRLCFCLYILRFLISLTFNIDFLGLRVNRSLHDDHGLLDS